MVLFYHYVREKGDEREVYTALIGLPEPEKKTKPKQTTIFEGQTTPRYAEDIRRVHMHYQRYHPRTRLKPDSREWKAVKERLSEGWTVADLCLAIDGIHGFPWHRGQNAQGKKWLGLELCCRNSGNVQKFLELAKENPDGMFDGSAHEGGEVEL